MQDVVFDEAGDSAADSGLRRALYSYLRWGGAALSVMVVALLVLWGWRLGVRDASEIPVIRAAQAPARVAPEDPGGTTVAHQGLAVNEILAGGTASAPGDVALAPAAPELTAADDPPPDPAPADAAAGDGAVVPFATLEDPESAPAPGRGAAETSAEASAPRTEAEEILALIAREAEERTAPDAAPAGDGGTSRAAPVIPRPRVRPDDLRAASAAPAPDAAPAPPADAAGLPSGALLLQLGAYDSEATARAEWARLLRAHGDLLGGRAHYVIRAESNGRTFWRLRVAGFDDVNAQRALCDALRARGADCIGVRVR